MYGSVTVAVRGMTKTESFNTLLIWQLTSIAFFHAFLLLVGCPIPAPVVAAILFGSGFANAIGQCFWTQSLACAGDSGGAVLLSAWSLSHMGQCAVGRLDAWIGDRGRVWFVSVLVRSAVAARRSGAFTSPALDRANCAKRTTHFRHLSASARRELEEGDGPKFQEELTLLTACDQVPGGFPT
jgi:hypothetical protein